MHLSKDTKNIKIDQIGGKLRQNQSDVSSFKKKVQYYYEVVKQKQYEALLAILAQRMSRVYYDGFLSIR